ncbi:MAG TPA: amidohydrolase family protein [Vicinamibacterales bacterium]|nr:amidohydrolase family protein [Vicinamibacterales bacterium]
MRSAITSVFLGAPLAAVLALAGVPRGTVDVTVHEGTSMAIALSPDKTRIAIDLQGGLWIVPIAGGQARRITDEYGDARQPSWSSDGRTIAFQSYRDGTWRIWTVGADGANLKAVTSGSFDDREPQWSPDGTRIAFSSDRSGNYDVWVLEPASGRLQQITTNGASDFAPAWSPDGREIAFVSTRTPSPGVYAATLDGQERLVASATGSVGAPSWSPDRKVLFTVVPTGTSGESSPQLVYDGKTIATGEDYFPFRAQWLTGDEFLYPADGAIKRRSLTRGTLASTPFSATLAVRPANYSRKRRDFDSIAPTRSLGMMHPVASPDGSRVAFAALGDLWTLTIGDGTPRRVTDDAFVDTDPAWSPDGSALAFASDRAGNMDIWVHDLRTGSERRLTSLPDADMAPAWSPDGKWIAFVDKNAYEQGELYVVASQGGTPRKLHDRVFGAGYPSWTPDGRFVITSGLQAYSSRYREVMNYYWAVPVDGGPAKLVVPTEHVPIGKRSGDGPLISPDGRQIAYVSNDYLFVAPIDAAARPSGPPRQLTRELADSISWAGNDRILYIATDRLKLVSVADGSTRDVPADLTWHRKIPQGRLVVHAGRLVDGVHATARTDVDVVIERNRIVSIEPHRPERHAGVAVVDASGETVMPGLIEGHGHTLKAHGDLFGRVHLAYGVTSFRDVGAQPYDALEDKEAIESGRRVGPRVFTTGYLLDGWRPYYPMASTAPTEAVVDLELDRARRLDYDMFKTYVRLPDLLQRRAIEGAHRIGIPTSSHEIYPAALSGGDSIEHAGATSRRGYSTKESLTGRAYEDVIQIVAKSGLTFAPTLALGGFQLAVARDPSILDDPRWTRLQPHWTDESVRARQAGPVQNGRVRAEQQKTVLALQRAGATIIAGVDSPLTPYATALHYELQDLVASGLTPFEALKTATINTATLMGAGADLGSIEAGKLADLVVVDGNPLVDIRDTLRVRKVIKNGELFTIEQLLDSVPFAARSETR